MKRLVKILLVAIPLLVIIALVAAFFSMNAIVKTGIQEVGTVATGTAVVVDSVRLSPFSGDGRIAGLTVANPEGFKTDYAFKLGSITLSLDPSSLPSDTIVISEIRVEGPEITLEQGLRSSNIGVIRKNVEQFVGTGGGAEEPGDDDEGDAGAGGRRVRIDRLVISGARLSVSTPALMGRAVSLSVPEIELTDLGKETEPMTIAEALDLVLATVTRTVLEVAGSSVDLGKYADSLKVGLGGVGEAAEGVQKEAEGVIKGIKGILGGD
jgi:hypothetical protein